MITQPTIPPRIVVLASQPIFSAVAVISIHASGLVALRPCDEAGDASGDTFYVRVAAGTTPTDEAIITALSEGRETVSGACRIDPDFIAPPPESVTRRQLFLWLNSIGVTRASLRAQLAGSEAALIELEEATEFQRSHPLVAQLGAALGINSAAIDHAFRTASVL